jgi:FKBP-type peptidyl-prolyl cis-trans isomerase SlyD
MRIEKNSVVTIDFTLRDVDGDVLESSEENGPLVYMHGTGELPPGIERALEGKSAGEKIDVTVEPEEGYGEYNEELVQEIARDELEGMEDIELGHVLEVEIESETLLVTVVGIEDDHIVVDGNNPFAGQTIQFQGNVLGVRAPTTEEVEHGHVHGEDCGHDHG